MSMRGPEFKAHTCRPASHSIFIAVLPPAPVPTTITSKVFEGKNFSLLRAVGNAATGRFTEILVFRIIGMRTTRHLWPGRPETGIAESLQTDFGGVVPHDGVITHHLKKRTPRFCCWFEFLLVSQLLEKAVLLLRRALHKFPAEERLTASIDPAEAGNESVLRFTPRSNGFVG